MRETARRIYQEARILAEPRTETNRRQLLDHIPSNLILRDALEVLGRHHDIGNKLWFVAFIDHGHLRLAVRAQPVDHAGAAIVRQLLGQFVCQVNRQRHQLRCFV